jgi:hypothetical protein
MQSSPIASSSASVAAPIERPAPTLPSEIAPYYSGGVGALASLVLKLVATDSPDGVRGSYAFYGEGKRVDVEGKLTADPTSWTITLADVSPASTAAHVVLHVVRAQPRNVEGNYIRADGASFPVHLSPLGGNGDEELDRASCEAPADDAGPSERKLTQSMGGTFGTYRFVVTTSKLEGGFVLDLHNENASVQQRLSWPFVVTAKGSSATLADADLVTFQDLDFDGNVDLLLSLGTATSGTCIDAHRFDPATGRFQEKSMMVEPLCGMKVDRAHKRILTTDTNITCCEVQSMTTSYGWKNGALVKLAEKTQSHRFR